MICKGSLSH